MMKRILWMLGGVVLAVVVAGVVYLVWAGNIDSSQGPDNVASRMYTLKNIYDYLTVVDNPPPAKSTSATFVEPTAGPGSTMNTTDQIFANLTRFPATGQTTSYATGDDGDLKKGATKRYIAAEGTMPDGTTVPTGCVYDSNTGLMWAADGNGVGCFGGETKAWANAVSWADGLSFAEYDDWRLPNAYELYSITKLEYAASGPYIDTAYFPNTKSSYYWSSTTSPNNTDLALLVVFNYGGVGSSDKANYYYVRAVRLGQ